MKSYELDGKIEAGLALRDDEDKRPRTTGVGSEIAAVRLDMLTRTAAPDSRLVTAIAEKRNPRAKPFAGEARVIFSGRRRFVSSFEALGNSVFSEGWMVIGNSRWRSIAGLKGKF